MTTQSITVTESAKTRILNLVETSDSNKFRVYVTGGGCSGFQYGFKFDQEIAFDDDEINFTDFSVVLDSLSYPYLYGSTLDFVEDLSGSKFVINNPNAKTTCGCGESFSI
ncbi:iron-sulfur cluster insertion protein ErpA [SAR86 cluster bacterium]|jgi:iron-sulfur cluster insertion protein|nr:iron-sulfur cluster insertion protein ErpA [SAR86 cluster bacterium]|tara:strand:- start:2758 stop:3087 length:330 start_codon:yes stop_codon:yes gene_type:complete